MKRRCVLCGAERRRGDSVYCGRCDQLAWDASVEGVSCGGKIMIQAGMPPAQEVSVLLHELAHELMHQRATEKPASRAVREAQAECVACILSESLGLQSVQASADYIHLYQEGKDAVETLRQSLDLILRTARMILNGIADEGKGKAVADSVGGQDGAVSAAA